jgi:cytochrome c oxidase assembly protein subunit 15
MSDPREPADKVPRWLHWWSVLTACAALPLVTLGAEVTTKKVGMVDKVGFRAPWHLFGVDWRDYGLGYLIEHGHRLAGFVVGICCIVLAVGLTAFARGRVYRCLGWVALAAVSAQGILGIYRVNKHVEAGPVLALIHGCSAQLVFATLVGVAVLTSRAWAVPAARARDGKRASVVLAVLVYVQIVFGAVVRHLFDPVAQRVHVLLAFVVLAVALWLIGKLWQAREEQAVRRLSVVLAVLLVLQPVLGVEAWIRRFGSATLPELVPSSVGLDLARTGHQVVGTLLFATAVAVALLLHRPAVATVAYPALPSGRMEGAA